MTIPRDIVPPSGLTLDTLRSLDALAGQTVTVTEPGQVITDPDGIPIGVGPSIATTATFAGAAFTRHELDALGGHPDDFPNLTFIDLGADHD